MKQITLFFFGCLLSCLSFGQIAVGNRISDIALQTILNAPVRKSSLHTLKGKVVLLEFWATWCSPCVEAMPNLQEMQKTYPEKLQVIAVSTEKESRIRQFIQNRPSILWFAVDTADAFRKDFPYHTIPHSVLIDQNGYVVAITAPEHITRAVIADVIAGKKIHLPLKEDNMNADPWTTYFTADTTTISHFIVQPKIDGLGSGSKTYPKDINFRGRRISMMNVPLETAYRIAFGDLPYGRTIDLTAKEDVVENKKMYCIDIIVPRSRENELLPTLRKELRARFELKASVEKRLKPVYVLTIADTGKIRLLKRSDATEETFGASHGAFDGEAIRCQKIADYLEGFGLVDRPVVDETGDSTRYNISFTYMPEKKGDLEVTLLQMGFKLVKTDREIDMLVFR